MLIILVFVADRLFKEISIKKFSPQYGGEDFFIVPKLFYFTFFKNEHLAFSLPLDISTIVIISIVLIAALFIILFREFKMKNTASVLMIGLVIIGALSNLQDRVTLGFVIDYFHLYPISYFNLADMMIGAGIVVLIFKFKETRNKQI